LKKDLATDYTDCTDFFAAARPGRSGGKEYEVELAELSYQNTRVPILKLALYEKNSAQDHCQLSWVR